MRFYFGLSQGVSGRGIAKHRGRIFKLMGDGLLAEFASAVDAVECAVALQIGLAERNNSKPEAKRDWQFILGFIPIRDFASEFFAEKIMN
jgi:class 3 adenylate cyclase